MATATQKSSRSIPRRVRRFSKRVSTACGTCKLRRIKCDLGVPACEKCSSTGRKCDGYGVPGITFRAVVTGSPNRRLPHPSPTHNASSPEEGRALQFYRERTAVKLSDHAHPEFWLRLVPQAGYSDPAIKHMMIAIASVEEALDITKDPWRCYDSCIRNHSKAIQSITRTSPAPPVEVALMFSLLFSTYSNMHGRSSSALDHVHNGLNIIREWRSSSYLPTRQQSSHADGTLAIIEEHIGPIFTRLEQQIAGLEPGPRDARGVLPEPVGQPELLPFLIPRIFANPHSAQKYLRGIMSLVLHCMQLYSLFPNQDLDSVRALQAKNYLSEWLQSFEACRGDRSQQPLSLPASRECHLLEVHHRAFSIMMNTFSIRNEMTFDRFEVDFAFIITQTRAFMTTKDPDLGNGFHHNSSHDASDLTYPSRNSNSQLGLIPPLFLTATRCRDPNIRRRAISILRSLNCTEGIWNNESAARIAEQVMLIEERGIERIRGSTEITEQRRVRLSSVEFDPITGRLLLKFRRFPYAEHPVFYQEGIIWPARVSEEHGIQAIEPYPTRPGVLRLAGYQGLCDTDDGCTFDNHEACYGRHNFAWACRTWSRTTST